MASSRFQMSQNDVLSISNPARVTAVGGDNATEFFILFPFNPPGSQWVFPFTYGFMYVVDSPSYQPVKIDASQFPPGSAAPVTTVKIAQLVAYNTDQVFNPGVLASGQTVIKWNILSSPAAGSLASAVKAAASGTTHVADFFLATLTNSTAVGGGSNLAIADGASAMINENASITAVANTTVRSSSGPGLNLRGTPGNSMTIQYGAGIASIVQSVNLLGYDQ